MKYLPNVVTLEIDHAKCTGCGACLEVCPHRVFQLVPRPAPSPKPPTEARRNPGLTALPKPALSLQLPNPGPKASHLQIDPAAPSVVPLRAPLSRKVAAIRDRDACMECGACAKNCPSGAVKVQAGVGCAYAVIRGILTNSPPSCDCSGTSEDDGSCC